MLGTAGGREPFRSLPTLGTLVYCAVEDIDVLSERARAAATDIPLAPADAATARPTSQCADARGTCGRSAPTGRSAGAVKRGDREHGST